MEYIWETQGIAKNMQDILNYIRMERNMSVEEIKGFIQNPIVNNDPFLFTDMQKIIDKLKQAKDNNIKICIIGDYDVDGICSTATLYLALKQTGFDVIYKLPNRFIDGYGLKNKLVDYANENDCKLIITVDNGIAAKESVEYAKQLGLDIIITDHHEPKEDIPDCLILDAKLDKRFPFDDLCGCGVALKLVEAMMKSGFYIDDMLYEQLMQITSIATIADAVSLLNENRSIVIKGLSNIKNTNNIGLRSLFQLTGLLDKNIEADSIGFLIAPCMNAAGRIDSPDIGLELLLSDDEVTAEKLSNKLIELNVKRKEIQAKTVESLEVNDNDKIIISIIEGNKAGISGIIASKIVDTYLRPSFVFSENDSDIITGSARTFEQFNILNCITNNMDIIEGGGGHKGACGMAIKKENIDIFRARCNELYDKWLKENPENAIPKKYATCNIEDFKLIQNRLINNMDMLKPFGNCNPMPIFISKNVHVDSSKVVGKHKNVIQFNLSKDFTTIKAVGFEIVKNKYESLNCCTNVDILYSVGLNEWPANNFNIQLNIIDLKESKNFY